MIQTISTCLNQFYKICLRVGPALLHVHLLVWWSDQHALHHAFAADVIEGRVLVSGIQGCELMSLVLSKLGQ